MKSAILLKFHAKERVTSIEFGYAILLTEKLLKTCQKLGKRFVVLSDTEVADLYANSLLKLLEKAQLSASLITIGVGEKYKNRKTKEEVEDSMLALQLGRDTCLIAIGGGVVTDLGGFVAATYCRGIPYLTIPTSLLAMVDASIGGKTGLNTEHGKNLIGALYPPDATFIDLSMLSTLPQKEMRNGTAEMIKHGLIKSAGHFKEIAQGIDKWHERSREFFEKVIFESYQLKKEVVEADPEEKGLRRILNFGHTIAHAIETLEKYAISHGEAVAIGVIVESFISFKMGYLSERDFRKIKSLFQVMKFPLKISRAVTINGMIEVMKQDKKAFNGLPRFVILEKIGKTLPFGGEYCSAINELLLEEVLTWMVTEFA